MKSKLQYFVINKPFKVLSQFTDENGNPGLGAFFALPKNIYPVGRLDLDSEGLLILTNDKSLNNKLLNPKNNHSRTYLVEVEGVPDNRALSLLSDGLEIRIGKKMHKTKPAQARIIDDPLFAEREPPVNRKKHPITSWLEIILIEGKNRQVRKMTAKVGHPTLRLIRSAIEDIHLESMKSGEIKQLSESETYQLLKLN